MTAFATVARQGRGWLPVIGVVALIGSLVSLALPSTLGRAVDAIVAREAPTGWLALAAGLIALGLLGDLVDAFADTACVAGTTAWLRRRLVRRVLAGGPAGIRSFDPGDLVSRLSGDAADAARAGPAAVTAAASVIPPVGSLVLLIMIDPWLAVAFVAGVALVIAVLWLFTRRTTEISRDYQVTQGKLAAALTESLAGIRTIAAAGTLDREQRRILRPLRELHRHGLQTWQVLARSGAQSAVVGPLVLVSVLAVGGVRLAAGEISAGDLFAAAQYAVLGAGLGSLTGLLGELGRARAGISRAAEVLAIDTVGHGIAAAPAGTGRLEFRRVSASAGGAERLTELDLDLPGGARVAVVGPSGSGKSVLAALAARLRDPDTGQVLLDGVELAALSRPELRRLVGCAFERPSLFGRTVGESIMVGRSVTDARNTPADAETLARATHAHDFISRLPAGYDTPLAQAPMSGGEAQRLGLARAWPGLRLLVLDDATSSVDTVTEAQIGASLLAGDDRRTRLIVTHRLGTATRADLVVWLDGGRLRGFGPHDRLWSDPDYRDVFG